MKTLLIISILLILLGFLVSTLIEKVLDKPVPSQTPIYKDYESMKYLNTRLESVLILVLVCNVLTLVISWWN